MKNSLEKFEDFISTVALTIVGAIVLFSSIQRPIWFDEALTVLKYLSASYSKVYSEYFIPNNHIAYTWILKISNSTLSEIFPFELNALRLPSVFFALLGIIFLFAAMRLCFLKKTAVFSILLFIFSPAFVIYGTAIRGYMLSFFLCSSALFAYLKFYDARKKIFFPLFFLISLCGVASIPSNIISFLLIPLLPLKSDENNTSHDYSNYLKKHLPGIIAPALAFILFYLPIAHNLIHALQHNNGWISSSGAIVHFYSAFLISFFPLFMFTLIYACSPNRSLLSFKNLGTLMYILMFSVPLLFFLRHPVPFPRVFFQLWPIYLFILSSPLDHILHGFRSKQHNILFLLVLSIVIISSTCIQKTFIASFSNYLKPQNSQDDFFQPYFMNEKFKPEKIVEYAHSMNNASPVFISVFSDYPSLLFYSRLKHFPDSMWLFDSPVFKPNPKLKKIAVVVKNTEDLKLRLNQFNMNHFSLLIASPNQYLFLIEK